MKITSKSIARSALIAALYVVMTLPLGSLATQPFFQIRPGEALAVLPLLMPSAIVGLSIGCFIVNLVSSSLIDALLGTAITLLACIVTRQLKNVWLGGIPPIIFNAFGLPLIFILLGYETAYWYTFLQILLSETVWVYALGIPLYYLIKKLADKNPKLFE